MRATTARRHHPVVWIVLGTALLLGVDAAAWLLWWAWHLMPWLLAVGVPPLAAAPASGGMAGQTDREAKLSRRRG